MAGRGQPGDLATVGLAAVLVVVGEPREQRVVLLMVPEQRQVLGQLVVTTRRGRKERRRVQTERVADGHHPPWRRDRRPGRGRAHRFEQGQRQSDPGSSEKGASVEGLVHRCRSLKSGLCVTWWMIVRTP